MPQSQPDPNSSPVFQLSNVIRVIIRRKATIVLVFLTVFIGVVLNTLSMAPIYEASATLYVKDEKAKSGILGELSRLNTTNPINAEMEILKSRTNVEQVVRALHLDWQFARKSEGFTIHFMGFTIIAKEPLDWQVAKKPEALYYQLLEFTSTAQKPSYQIELGNAGAYTVKDEKGNFVGQGQLGKLMEGKDVTLLLNDLRGHSGDSFVLSLRPFGDVVTTLQSGIKVKEEGRATSIIRVSYSSTDPIMARDIVKALVQAYLGQNVALKSEEANRTASFIEDQLRGLSGDLDSSEKNLEAYKSSSGVIKLDAEAEEMIKKISVIEKDRAEVTLQKKQIEFALSAQKEAMLRGDIYSPTTMRDDPLVAGIAVKLSDLEMQKRALRTEYTESHPAVKTLQGQIDEVQKKIRSTYETGLTNLTKQQSSLSHQMAIYEGKLRKLPQTERDLARLTRLSKSTADTYTFLLQKQGEARIAKASMISNIDIVDPPIIPRWPISSKKKQNLLLGLIVGLSLGIGLAYFQEYLDNTIKDVGVAKRVMGLPLLAVIPHIPQHLLDRTTIDKGKLFTQLEPNSVGAESFRSLRTNLHFSALCRDKKIMVVTSTFPSEGKTFIAAHLAHILSRTGVRVLLIDCNFQSPSLHTQFGHSKTPGLSDVLVRSVSFAEARHNVGISGLDLVTSGRTPRNPSEFLGSKVMRRFLLSQRANYDHIVIDTPSMLAVTDVAVLTEFCDLIILVMETGRVPMAAAQHMHEYLAMIQAPVGGLVMNDKTGKSVAYGYGRYDKSKAYGYGSSYGSSLRDDRKSEKKIPWWKKFVSMKVRHRK